MSEADNIRAFFEAMQQQNVNLRRFFTVVAAKLSIPYLQEREGERLLATRHEGKWVPDEHGGRVWDSGKDFASENGPDSYNSVGTALDKLRRPTAMWYHNPSMNLVILDESGTKVGVRSVDLRVPLIGLHPGNVRDLIGGLLEKIRAN